MNDKKLKELEKKFFKRFPGGFDNPEIVEIKKKHPIDKMKVMVDNLFSGNLDKSPVDPIDDPKEFINELSKVITRSSMLSIFEKPKFRDWAQQLSLSKKRELTSAYRDFILEDPEEGFFRVNELLQEAKLAKWSILTIIPFYHSPQDEIFIKPTTTKDVINFFDLPLVYRPQPSYDFYQKYKKIILEMKKKSHPSLGVNNAAFTGFLMMGLELLKSDK